MGRYKFKRQTWASNERIVLGTRCYIGHIIFSGLPTKSLLEHMVCKVVGCTMLTLSFRVPASTDAVAKLGLLFRLLMMNLSSSVVSLRYQLKPRGSSDASHPVYLFQRWMKPIFRNSGTLREFICSSDSSKYWDFSSMSINRDITYFTCGGIPGKSALKKLPKVEYLHTFGAEFWETIEQCDIRNVKHLKIHSCGKEFPSPAVFQNLESLTVDFSSWNHFLSELISGNNKGSHSNFPNLLTLDMIIAPGIAQRVLDTMRKEYNPLPPKLQSINLRLNESSTERRRLVTLADRTLCELVHHRNNSLQEANFGSYSFNRRSYSRISNPMDEVD